MHHKRRSSFTLLFSILFHLVSLSISLDGLCDSLQAYMYCPCSTKSKEVYVTCFLTNKDLTIDDDSWRSLGKVENAVSVHLLSVLPTRLNYIPKRSLEALTSLRTLTMQEADLGHLEAKSVHGLNSLQELQLDGCQITVLEPHAISDMPVLKKLSLNENLLQQVLDKSLTNLPELEWLYLKRNNISRVEPFAFSELHNLKVLSLSGNQITDITDYMFRGLRYLQQLELSTNQIRILNDKVFHHMPRLLEIDIKDNLINHISPYAFQGLEKLQRLWLNKNRIKMLPDKVFKPLPHLRLLYLNQNELETLSMKVVKNIALFDDEHFSISFKENPFVCDCRLWWIKEYLEHNTSHLMTWEVRDIKCREDSTGKEVVVHQLEMDCTKKSTTTTAATSSSSRSVTQAVSFVPHEISKLPRRQQENNVTFPDDDGEYLNQQDGEEMEEERKLEMADPVPTSGAVSRSCCWTWSCLVIAGTLFLSVRRLRGV